MRQFIAIAFTAAIFATSANAQDNGGEEDQDKPFAFGVSYADE